jgi:hypothetical protein
MFPFPFVKKPSICAHWNIFLGVDRVEVVGVDMDRVVSVDRVVNVHTVSGDTDSSQKIPCPPQWPRISEKRKFLRFFR